MESSIYYLGSKEEMQGIYFVGTEFNCLWRLKGKGIVQRMAGSGIWERVKFKLSLQ